MNLGSNKNFKNLCLIVSLLCVSAILTMDLGVSYTENEEKIYKNKHFQLFAVFASTYSTIDDIKMSLIVTFLWYFIKNK